MAVFCHFLPAALALEGGCHNPEPAEASSLLLPLPPLGILSLPLVAYNTLHNILSLGKIGHRQITVHRVYHFVKYSLSVTGNTTDRCEQQCCGTEKMRSAMLRLV